MNSFASAFALLVTAVLSSVGSVVAADNNRVVYETEIDADIDAVWNAFTTNDGLQKWMASLVEIEFAVGGKMKSNYNAKGKIGDETTIENTILSFDPMRMLSLKATGFPKGFPFEDARVIEFVEFDHDILYRSQNFGFSHRFFGCSNCV